MTGNRARQRAIRARMRLTGEPYALAARRHDAERARPTTVTDVAEASTDVDDRDTDVGPEET